MQYHRFEALVFPRNEEKRENIRKNWKLARAFKILNFDEVIKVNHVTSYRFFVFL